MRQYEIMFILPAEADEALVGTTIGRIEKAIAEHGGAIGSIDRWGRRRFAYEMADRHEGYYVVATFQAEPAAQLEIERTLNLADEVLRHKVMLLPERRGEDASPAPAETSA